MNRPGPIASVKKASNKTAKPKTMSSKDQVVSSKLSAKRSFRWHNKYRDQFIIPVRKRKERKFPLPKNQYAPIIWLSKPIPFIHPGGTIPDPNHPYNPVRLWDLAHNHNTPYALPSPYQTLPEYAHDFFFERGFFYHYFYPPLMIRQPYHQVPPPYCPFCFRGPRQLHPRPMSVSSNPYIVPPSPPPSCSRSSQDGSP